VINVSTPPSRAELEKQAQVASASASAVSSLPTIPEPGGGAGGKDGGDDGYSDTITMPLLLCTVKEARETNLRFTFSVVSPQSSVTLQAEVCRALLCFVSTLFANVKLCVCVCVCVYVYVPLLELRGYARVDARHPADHRVTAGLSAFKTGYYNSH